MLISLEITFNNFLFSYLLFLTHHSSLEFSQNESFPIIFFFFFLIFGIYYLLILLTFENNTVKKNMDNIYIYLKIKPKLLQLLDLFLDNMDFIRNYFPINLQLLM